jgi:hypothetical protein
MANKPSIPKGTRDVSSEEMVKRNSFFKMHIAIDETLDLTIQ